MDAVEGKYCTVLATSKGQVVWIFEVVSCKPNDFPSVF